MTKPTICVLRPVENQISLGLAKVLLMSADTLCFYGEISQTFCKLSQNTYLNYATGIFCIRENKDTDQLHSNRAADQGLCFRYIYSIIPLLPKSKTLNHFLWLCSPVYVRPG